MRLHLLLPILFLMLSRPASAEPEPPGASVPEATEEAYRFTFDDPRSLADWFVVTDQVLGGRSEATITSGTGTLVFTGVVDGPSGFALATLSPSPAAVRDCTRMVVRFRGRGCRFSLVVRTDQDFSGISYQETFSPANEWQELDFDLRYLVPTHQGRRAEGVSPVDPGKVTTVGFMTARGTSGPFRLEVDWIDCLEEEKPGQAQ